MFCIESKRWKGDDDERRQDRNESPKRSESTKRDVVSMSSSQVSASRFRDRLGKKTETKTENNRSDATNNGGSATLDHAHSTIAATARAAGASAACTRESSACRSGRGHGSRVARVCVGISRDLSGGSTVGLDLERVGGCHNKFNAEKMVNVCSGTFYWCVKEHVKTY